MSTAPANYGDARSYDPGLTTTHLVFTSGTTGAVPATLTKRQGINTVARDGVGLYTVVANDRAAAFLNIRPTIKQTGSYSKAGACDVRLVSQLLDTATKSLQIQVVDGDGDAVEMASGDILYLTIESQWAIP